MFRIESVYDHACLCAMAKALRKTVRRKRSRGAHIIVWLLIVIVVLLRIFILLGYRYAGDGDWAPMVVIAVMALVVWREDHLNARISEKRMMPTQKQATTTFNEEGYVCVTEAATTEWKFSAGHIAAICDVGDYLVFVLNKIYVQGYDKRTLTGGSIEDFYRFLAEKTGKTVEKV